MALMELREGRVLDGHYRLKQLLGRGGMGEVWEAEHTRLPKPLAIKFLLALSRAEPELLMRFRREAEIASRLNHPSIVQVTDFNILSDGTAYIVMERLVGEDLRARLTRGPVTLAEAREITRQVGSALALAHREGVVHRDLKPENIFLCREADGSLRAKVLDFGISKLQGAVGQGTRDDHVLGTPGYMAPEQALGKNSSIDGRTDTFALATIVYEMLTGRGVFLGDTLAELCTKVLFHEPPPLDQLLPGLPRQLVEAVELALAKDPGARQPEIGAFVDAVVGKAPITQRETGFARTVASDVTAISAPSRAPAAKPLVDATDVLTRSERPSPPSDSTPARRRRQRVLEIGMAGLVIALLVIILGWYELQRERTAALSSTPVPAASEPPVQPPPPAPTRAPDAHEVEQPSADEGRLVTRTAPPDTRDPGALTKAAKSARAEPALSASARQALDQAESALERGDAPTALRLARSSMRDGDSERAFSVLARAYCELRDVGMVQAMLRNLSPAGRRQVRASCARRGLELP